MKPTFKQFLEDIDIFSADDYSTHDSDNSASEHDDEIKAELKQKVVDSKYKPFDAPFNNKEFELLQHVRGKETTIVLLNKKTKDAAVTLRLEPVSINLFGKKFTYQATELLSALKKYQGQGLAPLVYQAVMHSGKFAVGSSYEQTEGGAKTWTKTLKVVDTPIYVVVPTSYAISNVPAAKGLKDEEVFVLLKGDISVLKKIAYDSYYNRFMVIPATLHQSVTKQAIDATGTKTA